MSASRHPAAWCLMRRSTPSVGSGAVDLITPDELDPDPYEFVHRNGAPDTIAGWKALADGLLTAQSCAFHRNLEISSRYAWIYKLLPTYLKWAGMAAFASHHVRLALFPLRLDTDRTGYVNIPHSLMRQKALLMQDDPRDEQRHFRRHLLGASRVRHQRRRHPPLSLRRIFDEAHHYASNPCVLPRSPQTEQAAPNSPE